MRRFLVIVMATAKIGRVIGAIAALAATVISLGACGDLDNFTTVHDLRVLAVKSEPAGFLVPLDHPESLAPTEATLTALVVDPFGRGATLSFSGEACPDYIDTITAASGKGSTLCPGPEITGKFPPPLDTALATKTLTPGTALPAPASAAMIQYEPAVMFGLTSDQLGLFFSPQPTGIPTVDQSIQYNRDFSFDAIVNLSFTLGTQTASVIKRVVYWPLLPAALVPADPNCPGPQVANGNPVITAVELFAHRVDGQPMDAYADPVPTLSLSAKDELFVQPSYDPASAEHYLLRVKTGNNGPTETQCRHELLTFQFFTTRGTFSPADRQSELPPFLTSGDGKVHLDSQFKPPGADGLPSDGKVTIWVVVRDERAGASWFSRDIVVTP